MTKEAKNIIDRFFEQMKGATETLSELEARAAEVEEQEQKRNAAYADIAASEQQVEKLQQERRELMRFFQEADFEGDVQRKAKITKRRQAIDTEVKKLDREVERLHKGAENNEPNAGEVAELAASLDSLSFPNPYDVSEAFKRALWPHDGELSDRRRTAKGKLPSVEFEDYEQAKYGDEEYEKRQQAEERRRKEGSREAKRIKAIAAREAAIGQPRDERITSTERYSRLSDELDD